MKSGGEAIPSDTMSTAPSPADHEPGAGGLIEVETCWARNSAGEHYVDIVGVAGSIPAAPTISPLQNQSVRPMSLIGDIAQSAVQRQNAAATCTGVPCKSRAVRSLKVPVKTSRRLGVILSAGLCPSEQSPRHMKDCIDAVM